MDMPFFLLDLHVFKMLHECRLCSTELITWHLLIFAMLHWGRCAGIGGYRAGIRGRCAGIRGRCAGIRGRCAGIRGRCAGI